MFTKNLDTTNNCSASLIQFIEKDSGDCECLEKYRQIFKPVLLLIWQEKHLDKYISKCSLGKITIMNFFYYNHYYFRLSLDFDIINIIIVNLEIII